MAISPDYLIFYDSSRAKSLAAALTALKKYPTATVKDTKGLSVSTLNTYIATLTAEGTTRIIACVDTKRVEAVASTATLTITAGDAGETAYVLVDEGGATDITIGSFISAGTTDEADGDLLEASINAGTSDHGYSASNASGVVTVTAPSGVGATGDTYSISVVESSSSTLAVAITADFSAAVAGVDEVLGTAEVTVTEGAANEIGFLVINDGVNEFPIGSVTGDGAAGAFSDAIALTASINAGTDYHGFTAARTDAVITVSAPAGTGAAANAYALTSDVTNGGTLALTITTDFAASGAGAGTGVDETLSTSTLTFTGGIAGEITTIYVDEGSGKFAIGGIKSAGGGDEADALLAKTSINYGTAEHGYTADNTLGVLTVTAPTGSGATGDTYAITADVRSAGTLAVAVTNNFSANATGVTAVGASGDLAESDFVSLEDSISDDAERDNTAQGAGGANNKIQLDASASAVDDYYNNMTVMIDNGTGADQAREIVDYVGSTKTATVDSNWGINPDATSEFIITDDVLAYGRSYDSIDYPERLWSKLYSGVQVPVVLTAISKSAIFEKDNKTATSVAAGTLTDSSEFTTGKYTGKDYYVGIKSATTGAGQVRKISSNTTNVLTLAANWNPTPTGTVVYQIEQLKHLLYDIYIPQFISTFFWDVDNAEVQSKWKKLVDLYDDAETKAYTYQDVAYLEELVEQAKDINDALSNGVTL